MSQDNTNWEELYNAQKKTNEELQAKLEETVKEKQEMLGKIDAQSQAIDKINKRLDERSVFAGSNAEKEVKYGFKQ